MKIRREQRRGFDLPLNELDNDPPPGIDTTLQLVERARDAGTITAEQAEAAIAQLLPDQPYPPAPLQVRSRRQEQRLMRERSQRTLDGLEPKPRGEASQAGEQQAEAER